MFEERALQPDGVVFELMVFDQEHFFLRCRRGTDMLVEYERTSGSCARILRGRKSAYEFKSVEKLRYDFERDAEDAAPQG